VPNPWRKGDVTVKSMESQRCFRCGNDLRPGSLKYVVHIRVYADFDGLLSISDEDIEGAMDRILEAVESRDPSDLEREVYQEIGFYLCKGCRDRFVRDTTTIGAPGDSGVMVH